MNIKNGKKKMYHSSTATRQRPCADEAMEFFTAWEVVMDRPGKLLGCSAKEKKRICAPKKYIQKRGEMVRSVHSRVHERSLYMCAG